MAKRIIRVSDLLGTPHNFDANIIISTEPKSCTVKSMLVRIRVRRRARNRSHLYPHGVGRRGAARAVQLVTVNVAWRETDEKLPSDQLPIQRASAFASRRKFRK